MRYRKLGNTALEVSVLGFGSSALGNVFGSVTLDQACEAVDVAIDLGINFFDSSPYYGMMVAEERLGFALKGKRSQAVLATKCGRYGLSEFSFSRRSIRKSVEDSLKRLQTDYLDLLQAHDIEFVHEKQIVEETIPALRELQREGKVRFIGITGYPLKLLRRVATAAEVDSILSYCRYTLLNTDMERQLEPLSKNIGTGLINASPLMMGILTSNGAPPWHPAPDELKAAGHRAAAEALQHGVAVETIALQFALHQSFAASTLVGMSSAEVVRANVSTVEQPMDNEVLAAVRASVGNSFTSTWNSGLAENND